MKILLIHKFHYMLGGTETFHYNLAEALTAAGHEVIFFSMLCLDSKEYINLIPILIFLNVLKLGSL